MVLLHKQSNKKNREIFLPHTLGIILFCTSIKLEPSKSENWKVKSFISRNQGRLKGISSILILRWLNLHLFSSILIHHHVSFLPKLLWLSCQSIDSKTQLSLMSFWQVRCISSHYFLLIKPKDFRLRREMKNEKARTQPVKTSNFLTLLSSYHG